LQITNIAVMNGQGGTHYSSTQLKDTK
jgi:uncharacterized protein YjbI with pentapeptide repeats